MRIAPVLWRLPSRFAILACLGALVLALPGSVRAELIALDIRKRESFADGKEFGDTGAYEKLVGVARFAVDPQHRRNRDIVDLTKASRNKDGKVEFESDICILMPKDPRKGNGAILYDVNNRGNKLALGFFNRGGGGNNPSTASDAGDGWLFRRGYTVVWCGWIGELLPGNNRLLLHPPIATEDGKPIRGMVRYEMVADAPAESQPLSRREGHGSHPLTEKGEAEGVLTWRLRETDERVLIPREQWKLERLGVPKAEQGVPGTLPHQRVRVAGGFRPGYIYELIAEAEGPIVQGLGFAATRDLLSFLRNDSGKNNPLAVDGKPAIKRVHGFGVSQSGRFLREFVYQGFNADVQNRKVFDGLIPHVAGGGLGFFNHRFAQPTRHNGQQEEHIFPGDRFPFAYGDDIDPFTKRPDGVLLRLTAEPANLPKIMHTQSAAEYWHRSGSLVHTDPLGTKDAGIPANVRVFAFGGTQHGPAGDPPGRGIGDNLLNPGDYKPLLRALLDTLDAWVAKDVSPPASVYPRIDQGTLVDWRQKSTGFPALPGVRYPEVIQQPSCLDFGPHFAEGILTVHPPRSRGDYKVMVPKSDRDGNDTGTLLPVEVAVPLATYTGWNLRRRDAGAEGMLVSLAGSYIPFARTKEERLKTGDTRLSIEERYGDFETYFAKFKATCEDLVQKRYLLKEDAERLIQSREKVRDLFPKR
jgi:hypothetical protein